MLLLLVSSRVGVCCGSVVALLSSLTGLRLPHDGRCSRRGRVGGWAVGHLRAVGQALPEFVIY